MRLLAISGGPVFLEMLSGLCHLWGYEIRVLQEPGLALSTALELRPEVVLVDLERREMDGCEIARRMRRQPQLEGTFLIAVTDRDQEENRARIHEAEFDAHLVKPLDFQLLKCILQRRPDPARRPGLVPLHPAEPDRRRLL
jgi:DNA-binding response OmpR family regulator